MFIFFLYITYRHYVIERFALEAVCLICKKASNIKIDSFKIHWFWWDLYRWWRLKKKRRWDKNFQKCIIFRDIPPVGIFYSSFDCGCVLTICMATPINILSFSIKFTQMLGLDVKLKCAKHCKNRTIPSYT